MAHRAFFLFRENPLVAQAAAARAIAVYLNLGELYPVLVHTLTLTSANKEDLGVSRLQVRRYDPNGQPEVWR